MTKYALLVVDMQKAYFRNDSLAEVQSRLVSKINQLVETVKNCEVGVYNVVTEHARDRSTWSLNMLDDNQGYLFEDSEEVKLVDHLSIQDTQKIIKTRDSAFFHTSLAEILHAAEVETLVLCGVSTHSCIAQTAADAYAENFRVILLEDLIASHDPSYHQSALAMLKQEYRQEVVVSDQFISRLK